MQRLALTLCYILLASVSWSQANWLRKIGGQANDEITDVCAYQDYATLTTGYFNQSADMFEAVESSAGLSDVFLMLSTAEGQLLWSTSFGGSSSDRGVAVAADDDGNAYVTGFFFGTINIGGDQLVTSPDSSDVFVAKFDQFGSPIWARSFGANGSDIPTDIEVASNGQVYVSGQFRGVGDFGGQTLTSDLYSGTLNYSFDAFVTALDANGNFLFTKQAASEYDNRYRSLVADDQGGVYAVGEFGGDLTIDQTYANDIINAGLISHFGSSGTELLYRRLTAPYLSLNEIKRKENGALIIGGDLRGNFNYFGNTLESIPHSGNDHVFIMEVSSVGEFQWMEHKQSQNFATLQGLDIAPSGLIYTSGFFKCDFTQLSQELGESAFISMGYNDVFAMEFAEDGTPLRQRHFASPMGATSRGVAAVGNRVIVSGEFQKAFFVPRGTSSINFPENSEIEGFDYNPNEYVDCGLQGSGVNLDLLTTGQSEGSRDGFLTSCLSPNSPLLDYFDQFTFGCDLNYIEPCITLLNEDLGCLDEWESCVDLSLEVDFNTGEESLFGPAWDVSWSNGDEEFTTFTNGTGIYTVTTVREDGCFTHTTDFDFTLLPSPPIPLISDANGVNVASDNPYPILLCDEDILLWAEACEGCTIDWQDGVDVIDGVMTNGTGSYEVVATNDAGCSSINSVIVQVEEPLDLFGDPTFIEISTSEGVFESADSIGMCNGDALFLQAEPYPPEYGFSSYDDFSVWSLTLDGEIVFGSVLESDWDVSFTITESGWYVFQGIATEGYENSCDTVFNEFPPIIDSVYIELYQNTSFNPTFTLESNLICPGDSTLLTLEGADIFQFGDVDGVENVGPNEYLIYDQVSFSIQALSVDTNGCASVASLPINVLAEPTPVVVSNPDNGMLCPDESVILTATPGVSYSWIGPLQNEIGDEASLEVSQPGNYFCVVEAENGCILESNSVELNELNTPFILSDPGTTICDGDTVMIEAISNFPETLEWSAPLSGNDPVQFLTEAGIYEVQSIGCGEEATATIEIISEAFELEVTPSSAAICESDSVLIEVFNAPNEPTWFPVGEGNAYWTNTPGSYVISAVNDFGCSDQVQVTVEVTVLPDPSVEDVVGCFDQEVWLVGEEQATPFWTTDPEGQNIIVSNDSLLIPAIAEPAIYYYYNANGLCASEPMPVNVTISEASYTPVALPVDSICAGGDMLLEVVDPINIAYTWTYPDAQQQAGSSLFLEEIPESWNGWFTVYSSDQWCVSAPDSVWLQVYVPEIRSFLSAPDSLCEGEPFLLIPQEDAEVYEWITPNENLNQTEISIEEVSTADSGIYTLTQQEETCTYYFQPFSLYVGTYPDFDLTMDDVTCEGNIVRAFIPEGFENYSWHNGDDDPEIVIYPPELIALEAWNAPGCYRTSEVYVPELDCGEAFVNVFTPNGDGINEVINFGLHAAGLEEVIIFNRWGGEIIRLAPPLMTWGGIGANGNPVSEGTYYWVGNAGLKKLHGSLTVIRE